MMTRIVNASGLLTSLLGFPLILFAAFGPTYGTSSPDPQTGRSTISYVSAAHIGLDPRAIAFLVLMALCMIGVTVASYRSRSDGAAWLVLLRVCTVLLIVGVYISIASFGLLLAPAALCAVLAAGR